MLEVKIPPLCDSDSERVGRPVAQAEWVHAPSLLALQGEEDRPSLLDQSN